MKMECRICLQTLPTISDLAEHQIIHCFAKLKRLSQTINLDKNKTTEKPFACTICNQKFGRADYVRRHMRLHTGEKPYACTYLGCDKKFTTRPDCRTHMRCRHSESESQRKIYKCPYCNQTFTQANSKNSHINSLHLREKEYSCAFCSRIFYTQTNLVKHIKIHVNEKQYKCPICGLYLAQGRTLRKHISIHNGNEGFECEECGKSFQVARALTLHRTLAHRR